MVNLRRMFSSLGYSCVCEHPACLSVVGTGVVIPSFSRVHLLKGRTALSRRQGASGHASMAGAERVFRRHIPARHRKYRAVVSLKL